MLRLQRQVAVNLQTQFKPYDDAVHTLPLHVLLLLSPNGDVHLTVLRATRWNGSQSRDTHQLVIFKYFQQ